MRWEANFVYNSGFAPSQKRKNINALLENQELAETALRYDAFTDIEFNPEKSLNCQAQAAAIFVSLSRQGLIEKAKDFEEFSSRR